MSTVVSTQIGVLENHEAQNSWRLWLQWLFATTVGYLWAAAIATQLYPVVEYLRTAVFGPTYYFFSTEGGYGLLPKVAIGAGVIALYQWLVLRHYLQNESWRQWLGANLLGYVGGLFGSWFLL